MEGMIAPATADSAETLLVESASIEGTLLLQIFGKHYIFFFSNSDREIFGDTFVILVKYCRIWTGFHVAGGL